MEHILLIDDEPRIANFIQRGLTAKGFVVDCAHDGTTGLELTRLGRYKLVILDLRLPGMDGVSVLRTVRNELPEQKIIILSALSDVEAKVGCLELGAADYMTKPFSIAELGARIRARLSESSSPPERYLKVGNIKLDLQLRTANKGQGPVNLSAREFLLLQYLMRRRSTVSTRQELLSDVWGYSFDPGTNVVDVCVKRLRAKLGGQVVETVRNVGHRLSAA